MQKYSVLGRIILKMETSQGWTFQEVSRLAMGLFSGYGFVQKLRDHGPGPHQRKADDHCRQKAQEDRSEAGKFAQYRAEQYSVPSAQFMVLLS